MTRYDIINHLIRTYDYKSYLEIGTQHGQCFKEIVIDKKVCVDPDKKYDYLTYEMTSDTFFKYNTEKFDIIFVDGLHLEEQSTKDIRNSLEILNENGTVVVHDCLPHCEEFINVCWNGTVFRSIIDLRYNNPNVEVEVIDTDNGCGIIRKNTQTLYNKVPLTLAKTYDYYSNNKKDLMNIISVEEFKQKLASKKI